MSNELRIKYLIFPVKYCKHHLFNVHNWTFTPPMQCRQMYDTFLKYGNNQNNNSAPIRQKRWLIFNSIMAINFPVFGSSFALLLPHFSRSHLYCINLACGRTLNAATTTIPKQPASGPGGMVNDYFHNCCYMILFQFALVASVVGWLKLPFRTCEVRYSTRFPCP